MTKEFRHHGQTLRKGTNEKRRILVSDETPDVARESGKEKQGCATRGAEEISKELDAIQGVGSKLSQSRKISFVYCNCSSQKRLGQEAARQRSNETSKRIVIKRY
jgi:hypothetical protein